MRYNASVRRTKRQTRLMFWSIFLFIVITSTLTRSFAIPMIGCGLVAGYLIVWSSLRYLQARRLEQRGFEVILRKNSN